MFRHIYLKGPNTHACSTRYLPSLAVAAQPCVRFNHWSNKQSGVLRRTSRWCPLCGTHPTGRNASSGWLTTTLWPSPWFRKNLCSWMWGGTGRAGGDVYLFVGGQAKKLILLMFLVCSGGWLRLGTVLLLLAYLMRVLLQVFTVEAMGFYEQHCDSCLHPREPDDSQAGGTDLVGRRPLRHLEFAECNHHQCGPFPGHGALHLGRVRWSRWAGPQDVPSEDGMDCRNLVFLGALKGVWWPKEAKSEQGQI